VGIDRNNFPFYAKFGGIDELEFGYKQVYAIGGIRRREI
jgi:hypothetical protein